MDLSNLKAPAANKKPGKRVGRGEGSGKGQESGRGMNGQKSRSGYSQRAWFEGGQMPLQRRVPKFGFKNPNRVTHRPINVSTIAEYIDAGKLYLLGWSDCRLYVRPTGGAVAAMGGGAFLFDQFAHAVSDLYGADTDDGHCRLCVASHAGHSLCGSGVCLDSKLHAVGDAFCGGGH